LFNFTPKGLNPIGFVNVKEEITYMTWTPAQYVIDEMFFSLENLNFFLIFFRRKHDCLSA